MGIKWLYDACGEYFDWRGFTIIKQDHPKLLKYEITKEDPTTGELHHVAVCSTIKSVKETISLLIEKG